MTRVYEEIIDFIAAGSTSNTVAGFQPSDAARQRVTELIASQKAATLTPEDSAELDHFLELEHIMRLAKARARRRLVP